LATFETIDRHELENRILDFAPDWCDSELNVKWVSVGEDLGYFEIDADYVIVEFSDVSGELAWQVKDNDVVFFSNELDDRFVDVDDIANHFWNQVSEAVLSSVGFKND
jgi:hypothetical protein